MKYGNTYFLELTRELWTEKYKDLSVNAKWLFVTLNECEQRFENQEKHFFYRTDEDLAKDCGFSLPTLKRAKKELSQTDLVKIWRSPFLDLTTGKRSEKHVTCYRIKK